METTYTNNINNEREPIKFQENNLGFQHIEDVLKYNKDKDTIIYFIEKLLSSFSFTSGGVYCHALLYSIRYTNFEIMNYINDKFRDFSDEYIYLIVSEGILTYNPEVIKWLKDKGFKYPSSFGTYSTIHTLLQQIEHRDLSKINMNENVKKLRDTMVLCEGLFKESVEKLVDYVDRQYEIYRVKN